MAVELECPVGFDYLKARSLYIMAYFLKRVIAFSNYPIVLAIEFMRWGIG